MLDGKLIIIAILVAAVYTQRHIFISMCMYSYVFCKEKC